MPNTLLITAASGRKSFYVMIRDRDEINYSDDKFNPENEGQLLADTLWNMVPWATVQAMVAKLDSWEIEER